MKACASPLFYGCRGYPSASAYRTIVSPVAALHAAASNKETTGTFMYLRVAINTPLRQLFDYLPPTACDPSALRPGMRLRLPFGRSPNVVGILVQCTATSEVDPARLKRAHEVLDDTPVLDEAMMSLLLWAADYYHHPPGDVLAAALPVALRKAAPATLTETRWRLRAPAADPDSLSRAPRQQEMVQMITEAAAAHARAQAQALAAQDYASVAAEAGTEPTAAVTEADRASAAEPFTGVTERAMQTLAGDWRATARALERKELLERTQTQVEMPAPNAETLEQGPVLGTHQAEAVSAIGAALGEYQAFLLNGVTGSGKTEVYLRVIDQALSQGRQTLVLVPEIGLTPQLVQRFARRFATPIAVMHSGLTDTARLAAWRSARAGAAGIVLGTRSSVFSAVPNLGLIVVDEEHDASLKQQEGFRYSARDLAVLRAQRAGVPVVLGTATPSLESQHNVATGRYQQLMLPERAKAAKPPSIRLVDLRKTPIYQGLSLVLLDTMQAHLEAGGQTLIFLNRRGYAPAWFCAQCGWVADCQRCDARLTYHRRIDVLRCHHCASERKPVVQCPECRCELMPVGQGTEQISEVLEERFAQYPIARIDRDSTRGRGMLEARLEDIRRGDARILVGTQMLTKGHHFPDVTLVGVLNADSGLFGTDFRADERLAQLIVQVAGRAGRAEKPGEVLIQTSYPEHRLLQRLLGHGYNAFAADALNERKAAGWPPFASLALLRAEATDKQRPMQFLQQARQTLNHQGAPGVHVLGPAPAPMERRAGKYRAHLLLQSARRGDLHHALSQWLPTLAKLHTARQVRWSIDVDPIELY